MKRRKVGLFVEPEHSPGELAFMRKLLAASGFSAAVRKQLELTRKHALEVLHGHGLPVSQHAMKVLQFIDGQAPEAFASDELAAAFVVGVSFGILHTRLFTQLRLEKPVRQAQTSAAILRRSSRERRKITLAGYRAAKRKARSRKDLARLLDVTPQAVLKFEHAHGLLSSAKS